LQANNASDKIAVLVYIDKRFIFLDFKCLVLS